jgi:hypothetical protein
LTATARVNALALGWTGALALLAFEWTRTPLAGPGPAFLIWSLPALPLALLSWIWLRRLDLQQLPLRAPLAVLVVVAWSAVASIVAAGLGAEWELDGIVLRSDALRFAGIGLRWLPGVWGALLSVAGLAASLEARYRLAHPTPAAGAPQPVATAEVTPTGP